MRRRHLLIALLALPVLLLAGAAAFILGQDPDRYRADVAALLSESAGYPVTLGGPLKLSWRPTPALFVSDVAVQVPGARVSLATVHVSVEPQALLARQFRARQVIVEGLRVDLQTGGAGPLPATLPSPADLAVDELEIRGAELLRGGEPLLSLSRVLVREPQDPAGARVDLEGRFAGADHKLKARVSVQGPLLQVQALEAHTPAGVVEGRLSLRLDGERPLLGGEISANALTLAGGGSRAAGGRLIPRRPLDLAPLQVLDVDLRVRVGRLSLAGFRVSEVDAPVTLRGGRLALRARGVLAAGTLRSAFTLDQARWALELDVNGADAGDTLVMAGLTGAEQGGRLGLSAQLAATGRDTGAVLSSLSGKVALDVAKATVRGGRSAQVAGADVFASITRALRGDDSDRVNIECAVARFDVAGGVLLADETIGAQSRAMNLLGGGRVSLVDERLDLAFRPWPREGLGLSATAVVGTVAITGPLDAPEAGLTSEAALRGGATAGAALLTGGLSLIAQGLLERARGDSPCQDAAGKRGGARGKAAGGESPAGAAGGAVGEALEGVGRTLKGLFGGGAAGGAGGKADR